MVDVAAARAGGGRRDRSTQRPSRRARPGPLVRHRNHPLGHQRLCGSDGLARVLADFRYGEAAVFENRAGRNMMEAPTAQGRTRRDFIRDIDAQPTLAANRHTSRVTLFRRSPPCYAATSVTPRRSALTSAWHRNSAAAVICASMTRIRRSEEQGIHRCHRARYALALGFDWGNPPHHAADYFSAKSL